LVPDKKIMVTASLDGTLKFWKVRPDANDELDEQIN